MRSALAAIALVACAPRAGVDTAGTVAVPGGSFWSGSDLSERARTMDRLGHGAAPEAEAGLSRLRAEPRQRKVNVDAFWIMRVPVTHRDYHRFVRATGAAEPWVDRGRWLEYEVGYPYRVAKRYMWRDGKPAAARANHPVVLVDHAQASAYCTWWGEQHRGRGTLPREMQWERAARGDDGRAYPWGDDFDPSFANTLEARRGGTIAVGHEPLSGSPFGALDMAGNVFEWTRTSAREGGFIVKGGSWSSDASTARSAARHARDPGLRHVAIGFRCVLERVKPPK